MISSKVIVCDLDGTLTESKQPLSPGMAETVEKLLESFRLAVVSGASYHQFENQFLGNLNLSAEKLANLFLFPINGGSFYSYNADAGYWMAVYEEKLSETDKQAIYNAFGRAIPESGVEVHDVGGRVDILEDRGGQITFSGCGQEAPLDVKEKWDPDESKRKKIVDILKKILPDFEVRIGGATSIDITGKGIDKAYAIGKIEKNLKVNKEDIIYIGDALFPGGNDFAARSAGVECLQVSGPYETKQFLEKIMSGN
jgi:HAD superfamily hydrolase (TIGR01484 family)